MTTTFARRFASTISDRSTATSLRAIVYATRGDPSSVLRGATFRPLPRPKPEQVQAKLSLAAINPADLNTVEGVYPATPIIRPDLQPQSPNVGGPFYIGGNEGVGIVTEVGEDVKDLKEGDRVIVDGSHLGTWANYQNFDTSALAKLESSVTDAALTTIKINPPTAYCMLSQYVNLFPGDWVIQNGANSAVGQAVIQLAAARDLRTINLVRDRPDIEELKKYLYSLGATHVITYDELADKEKKKQIIAMTSGSGRPIQLGLNCVGGRDTTVMTSCLGHDATLVSYGAMSMNPLSLPTSYFIFRNLKSVGHMQSRWHQKHNKETRVSMYQSLADMIARGQLKEPEHEIISLAGDDEEVTQTVLSSLANLKRGSYGRKILLKWES